MTKKVYFLVLIILLTLYPITELTKVIVEWELIHNLHPDIPSIAFIAEITGMWTFYLLAILVLNRRLKED